MLPKRACAMLVALLCASCAALPASGIPEPISIVEPSATAAPTAGLLLVHVVGAVARPGVYSLPPEARLLEAIEAAGGAAPEADLERINLADRARDGMQIYVPFLGTPIPPSLTPVAANAPGAGARLTNINSATAVELDALPGIGPAYAERIIAYRQANGPFKTIDGLLKVDGIGQAVFDRVKSFITIE